MNDHKHYDHVTMKEHLVSSSLLSVTTALCYLLVVDIAIFRTSY